MQKKGKPTKNKKLIKKSIVMSRSGVLKKEKVTPLADRIILKPLSVEEISTTSSGIIIPDTVSKEKPEQGIVIAVGEGKWDNGKRVAMSIKVGDRVVFSRYGYDEIKIEGEEYYILKEENILAIVNLK